MAERYLIQRYCDSRFDQWKKLLNLFTDNQDVIRSHSSLPETKIRI